MNAKKGRILSLLLILVMVCTYVVEHNSFKTYAAQTESTTQSTQNAEQNGETTDEIILFDGTNTSTNWGQAVSLYSGTDFTKTALTADAEIAVTYESVKEPLLSLQSWTHDSIWQNVSAKYTSNGVAYFSVSEMMEAYESAYGSGYQTVFQDLDAIHVSDAGVDLTVTKVAITLPQLESNYYTEVGEPTQITVKAYAQNTTSDWTWMDLGTTVNLLYKAETAIDMTNTTGVFENANDSANFGLQVYDEKLLAGEGSRLKFHVGTITVKAEGYEDLIINMNKDYSETYLAETVSWGLTGNNTQISLTNYIPTDATEKTEYLKKIIGVTADITLTDYQFIEAIVEEPEFPDDYTYPTTMRDISAMDLVKDMKVGWNLGNSLEATGGETSWGNPVTKKKMIDTLKVAGFQTIRIPVRWDEHYIDDNYTIDPEYMKRIETVANYALANDMYAIINIHHNELQSQVNEGNKEKVLQELDIVWTQIAEHFKNYGDKLIFETINEPRDGENWTGNTSLYEITNEYNAKALFAIRKTGGNNEKRLVMLPTYTAGADYNKITSMVIPEDDHVAVSIHAYLPYNFAFNSNIGSQTTFVDSDKKYIDKLFKLLNSTFIEKGAPVVIGEFAATDKNNLADRTEYAKYYVQTAAHYGIPCSWWDNANFSLTSDSMGLFNRRTLTFVYPEIVLAMLEGWATDKVIEEGDKNILFDGIANSSNWGQALSLSPGLDFLFEDFTEDSVIEVDYISEKAPELILSGYGTGVSWVKVNPTKTYANGDSNIAYFTLTDMVNTYKNALIDYDSYGTIFPTLGTIYIGDTGTNLTVTKVYKTNVDGMMLPKVSVTTTNNGNYISQSYTISAERGTIDLSKVKIVYTATEMSTFSQNIWCDNAGLLLVSPPWYIALTDTVNCTINNGKLTFTFHKNTEFPEGNGTLTLDIRFAKTDWSTYGTLSNSVLQVYYNETLVQ